MNWKTSGVDIVSTKCKRKGGKIIKVWWWWWWWESNRKAGKPKWGRRESEELYFVGS